MRCHKLHSSSAVRHDNSFEGYGNHNIETKWCKQRRQEKGNLLAYRRNLKKKKNRSFTSFNSQREREKQLKSVRQRAEKKHTDPHKYIYFVQFNFQCVACERIYFWQEARECFFFFFYIKFLSLSREFVTLFCLCLYVCVCCRSKM